MIEIKEEFRKRLKRAMEKADMKAIDLAKRTGISEATISQYRSGYSKPKEDRLVLISNVLGVSPSWLMGLDVPMEPPVSTPAAAPSLSPDRVELLDKYDRLNDNGRKQLHTRADELIALGNTVEEDVKKGGGVSA